MIIKVLAYSVILSLSATAFAAKQLVETDLDFNLKNALPTENQIIFGYSKLLMPWEQWLKRKSSGPLISVQIDTSVDHIEVFEAHSAGIVKRPVSFFTKQVLHNIDTVRALDPQNTHSPLPSSGKFSLETVVPFPRDWADKINALKSKGLLPEKIVDRLIIKSEFDYLDLAPGVINANVNSLNIFRTQPRIINFQGLIKINEFAKFGSIVSLYYPLDAERTLIVNYFVLGIKKHYLDVGFADLNLRSVFMGESPKLNSPDGIGAGLPSYARNLFRRMFEGWSN